LAPPPPHAALASWIPWWTRRSPVHREPGMEIGVEGKAEETLLDLLLRPFRAA